jgi:hypothetical protein
MRMWVFHPRHDCVGPPTWVKSRIPPTLGAARARTNAVTDDLALSYAPMSNAKARGLNIQF